MIMAMQSLKRKGPLSVSSLSDGEAIMLSLSLSLFQNIIFFLKRRDDYRIFFYNYEYVQRFRHLIDFFFFFFFF